MGAVIAKCATGRGLRGQVRDPTKKRDFELPEGAEYVTDWRTIVEDKVTRPQCPRSLHLTLNSSRMSPSATILQGFRLGGFCFISDTIADKNTSITKNSICPHFPLDLREHIKHC